MAPQQIIQRMVERIVAGFHPDKIILFGSYARGTATGESDVDLLVVMPVSGSRRDLRVNIRTAIHGMGLAKDVVVLTPGELEKQRAQPGTIGRVAAKEGKILYDAGLR